MDNLESKYDLIIGNGCSFTEGGGLNHPDLYELHKHIQKYLEIYSTLNGKIYLQVVHQII